MQRRDRQQQARLGIVDDRQQTFLVMLTRRLRRVSRHRDHPGIQATEERRHVVRTTGEQQHRTVAEAGTGLQGGGDGACALVEVPVTEHGLLAGGVGQKAQGDLVRGLRSALRQCLDQREREFEGVRHGVFLPVSVGACRLLRERGRTASGDRGCTQENGWAGAEISGDYAVPEGAKGEPFHTAGLELKDTDTNYVSYLTIIIILNSLSHVVGSFPALGASFPLCDKVISMAEQLSTSKCDSPLLQAFVDNRSILVKIAARITGCRSRAEDVVQDAFFRLNAAPQITSSFKAQLSYLFQIVRNLAIDHYRKQAMELKYSGSEEEGLNVVLQNASPEATHINLAALDDIAEALNELPQRTRYAFEMYRLHGVPQKDIAKELGVSPTLVNFMIRDALVHCRKTANRQA